MIDSSAAIVSVACHRAWIEIDTDAIIHNIRAIQALLQPQTALMAVIKADAYGHGAIQVAQLAQKLGVSYLGVATVCEGIKLRRAGISLPIAILGATHSAAQIEAIVHWNLEPTLCSAAQATLWSESLTAPLSVHLKIDTGMSRLGPLWTEGAAFIEQVLNLPHLKVVSIYSHLATADELDPSFMKEQQSRFDRVIADCGQLQHSATQGPLLHLSNSAGTLFSPALHYDMVRVGLALYGIYPGPQFQDGIDLKPAMQVRTRITQIKTLPAGVGVSYGRRFVTASESQIATLGVGYADGVPRNLSNQMTVLVRGQAVPQVGTITMDQIMVDVSAVPEAQVGDVVTLLGQDGTAIIPMEAWSDLLHTIPYEIMCGFQQRLPRRAVSQCALDRTQK